MKKSLILALAAVMVVGISSMAMAVGNGNGLLNSPHDFSGRSWNTSGEICVVCHTPHNAKSTVEGLIWNHEMSQATYTMYDEQVSASLDGTVDDQPTGIAKLCLSCHDGTVAIDAFGMAGTSTEFVPGFAEIPAQSDGTNEDLRSTHPISIVYDDFADLQLNVATDTLMGTSGFISDVLDVGGKVQCSSCHDVHDRESVAGTALLRVDNTDSALCRTCHFK